jgi:hypothetical protein
VVCAISAQGIIQQFFFYETLKSKHYVRLILTNFFEQLTKDEKTYGNFMHDNATAHTAIKSLNALAEVFGV